MNRSSMLTSWYSLLPEMGVLSLSGHDAAKLLQGQTTCDIVGLPPGQTTLGALCTPKGRAVALFRVLRTEDRILLLQPSELCEAVRKRLSQFILRDDVNIEDATGQWAIFGLCGENAPEALKALGLPPLATENEAEGQVGSFASLYAIRIPDPNSSRLLVLVDSAKTSGMGRFLEGHGFVRREESQWQLEDIRAGLPTITTSTVEEFVPQMLNLDLLGAISFTKGCYTGQEIVARTHYLGSIKRRVFRLVGEGEPMPQAGETVLSDDEAGEGVGTVVSSAPSPDGGFELLAVMHASLAESGEATFRTSNGAGLLLSTLPYPVPQAAAGSANES